MQSCIFRILGRILSGAIALVPVLVSVVIAPAPVHAQTYTILYRFTDGGGPVDLIGDAAGNLYGITAWGAGTGRAGMVFKLTPAGRETVLYRFEGGRYGGNPLSVTRDTAGNLYGTTLFFGRNSSGCGLNLGCGVVFKLDPAGKEVVLYSFTGEADGGLPNAGLIRDEEGNLYGTTASGGVVTGVCPNFGCGVVFKLDPTGKETVL